LFERSGPVTPAVNLSAGLGADRPGLPTLWPLTGAIIRQARAKAFAGSVPSNMEKLLGQLQQQMMGLLADGTNLPVAFLLRLFRDLGAKNV
jgi:hypothetical protein